MQAGGSIGMQTMDNALMALVESGKVAVQEAYQQADNKHRFKALMDDPDDDPEL
jgi:Tfp pilus assembly ATPase PilU